MGSKETAKLQEDSPSAVEPLEAVWHLVNPDAENQPTAEELVETLPVVTIPFSPDRYEAAKRSIAGLPEEVQPRARQTLLATLLEGGPQTDRATYGSYIDRQWSKAIYTEVNGYLKDYPLKDASSQEVLLLHDSIDHVFANWSSLGLYADAREPFHRNEDERKRFRAMEYGLLEHPAHPDYKDPLALLRFAHRHYLDDEWHKKAFEDAARLAEHADLSDEDLRNQLFNACLDSNKLTYKTRSAGLSIMLSVAEQSDRSSRFITETKGRVFKRQVTIEQMPEFELRREVIGQTIDFVDLLRDSSNESFRTLSRYMALYTDEEQPSIYARINRDMIASVNNPSNASEFVNVVLPAYERFAPKSVYEELRQRLRQAMLGKTAREGAEEA